VLLPLLYVTFFLLALKFFDSMSEISIWYNLIYNFLLIYCWKMLENMINIFKSVS